MSTFGSLQIGVSSLYAQRRGLDVTGHNIANVGTEGYSRQRVEMASNAGPLMPAVHSTWSGTGGGVSSVDVSRMRDAFLEGRAHQEHATNAQLARVATVLGSVELALTEPSDTGIGALLADFWAGWDDVGLHPADLAARSQLLERAGTLAAGIRQLDGALDALRGASVEQLSGVVAEVNAIADRIAELNGRIVSVSASGLPTNDLLDQRDRLVLELAGMAGATVRSSEGGSVDVYLGGMALVRGTSVEPIRVEVGPAPVEVVSVRWAKDGLAATVGGEAAGLTEAANSIVPDLRAELAELAQQLADDVNALHLTGFDRNGDAGLEVFQIGPDGIVVNPALAANPELVAASSVPGGLDGDVARALAGQEGPDRTYRELVVRLGVAAQTANRRVEVQATITRQLDAARESVAGVNLDEEITNLLTYQHAFDASARFIRAIDEMLQTLLAM